jgi:hypothetical protein
MDNLWEWTNMSGVTQATFMNQRSFGPPVPSAIGAAYEGGFYAGQISTTANSVATHYLVVAPLSSGQTQTEWKEPASATTGADSNIDGPQNTADMVADGGSAVYPAAHFCNNLVVGGFSDWHMPARNELEVCYYNLKPTTTSNNTSSGINANAVPARASNYTAGTPAQTSASAFQTGGSEAFNSSFYWSSTEGSDTGARVQSFSNAYQTNSNKSNSYRVRAVRRVAL